MVKFKEFQAKFLNQGLGLRFYKQNLSIEGKIQAKLLKCGKFKELQATFLN